MNLNPTRLDLIRDKLLVIEMHAYQGRHLLEEQEDKLLKDIRVIEAALNELKVYVNTPNEKGKNWGWWK